MPGECRESKDRQAVTAPGRCSRRQFHAESRRTAEGAENGSLVGRSYRRLKAGTRISADLNYKTADCFVWAERSLRRTSKDFGVVDSEEWYATSRHSTRRAVL